MCGICGIYGEIDSTFTIEAMMRKLEHRGPDDSSWYIQKKCAFGHRRLSILDLSELGRQPMLNEDRTIMLVVNGEIYNYRDLRDQLKNSHIFYSESDSEVIVHAYEEWGEDFVNHLRGMFALAIYDGKQDKLILARDPIGKKPLYYALNNQGGLVFASEIKALFEAGVPKAVNYDMIPTFLMYQYSLGTDTLFKGVKKLPAGNMLITRGNGLELKRYWSIEEDFDNTFSHYVLRGLLNESVELRLQSDVPVGAFLSGGIDSSAVVALWRERSEAPIHTFTASFGKHTEAPYAKKVSEYLDTIYHEVPITPAMVAHDIEKITWHHDEPLGDAAVINNYYLAKEAKKYVTVVLAGEGGDELFGGYPWHKWAKYAKLFSHIPDGVKIAGSIALAYMGVGNITSKLYSFGRKAEYPFAGDIDGTLMYPTSATNWQAVTWLLKEDFLDNHFDDDNYISPNGISDIYNRALAMDCLNKLPEQYLMKADKATMAWGIEERLPLLDKKVIEYAFSLPPQLKRDKAILRQSVSDLLPVDIVNRPKAGFGTPVVEWMQSPELNKMIRERLIWGKLLDEICKPSQMATIRSLFTLGKYNSASMLALSPSNIIWSLFALETWYKVWFE